MSTIEFTIHGKLLKYLSTKVNKYFSKAKPWIIKRINLVVSFIESKKKKIIIGITIAVLSISGSLIMWYYQTNIITLYHVYMDGVEIGTVNDKEIINIWKSQYLRKAQSNYGPINLVAKNEITFLEEKEYKGSYDNYQVLSAINDNIEIEAKGLEIYVEGKLIGVVKDQLTYDEIINNIKQSYIPTNDKGKMVASTFSETTNKSVELKDISIKENINLIEARVVPEKIIDEEIMQNILRNGIPVEENYIVQENESIYEVASKYNMTLEKVYQLNPTLKGDNLQNGDELIVLERKPLITITSEETLFQTESIPYQVIYISEDSMYINESKLLKEGIEGKMEVIYSLMKENGVLKEIKIINEKIIEEPVEKVILKGTKEIPSIGTGAFNWPVNGGFITSYFGLRWGSHHNGIDIAGTSDYLVKAADNGTISYTGWKSGYGNVVIIDHGNGFETLYAHLNEITVFVGDKIAKGQLLGVMGSTGRSTGTHLHFEVKVSGEFQDPLDFIGI